MSEIQDSVEDTSTDHETIEMLKTWKMDQLKEWLLTRSLKWKERSSCQKSVQSHAIWG